MTEQLDKRNPWWLPPGSVRALLAVAVVGAFLWMSGRGDAPEAVTGLAGMVLGYYFKTRETEENGS